MHLLLRSGYTVRRSRSTLRIVQTVVPHASCPAAVATCHACAASRRCARCCGSFPHVPLVFVRPDFGYARLARVRRAAGSSGKVMHGAYWNDGNGGGLTKRCRLRTASTESGICTYRIILPETNIISSARTSPCRVDNVVNDERYERVASVD